VASDCLADFRGQDHYFIQGKQYKTIFFGCFFFAFLLVPTSLFLFLFWAWSHARFVMVQNPRARLAAALEDLNREDSSPRSSSLGGYQGC